jgi:hypothetical protein
MARLLPNGCERPGFSFDSVRNPGFAGKAFARTRHPFLDCRAEPCGGSKCSVKSERAVARAGPNDNPRSQALVKVTLDTLKRSLEYQTSALRSESAILTRIEKDCAKLADEAKALIVSVLTEREVELIKQRNNSQSTIQANTAELKELRNRSMNFPHFTGVGCLVAIGSFIVCVGVLGRSGIMPLGGIVVVCFGIWLGICFAIGIIRHELPISAQRSKKASVEVEMNRKIDTIETELATLQSLKLDLVGK